MTAGDTLLKGLQLLVVEDESLIALMIEDMLRDFGCHVVGPAESVSHALKLIDRQAIDGALLDVNLKHGQRSYPVAKALQMQSIPFAFVTGYGEAGLLSDFRGVTILQKPFIADHLHNVLTKDIAPAT